MSGYSLRRVFAIPLILQVLTAIGLVSALLGDGVWDAVSWCTLTVPLLAAAWHLWGRR